MAKKDILTDKQEKFAIDIAGGKYKHDWLAYEAHYDTKKMSKNAIYVETCRLIQNPKVALRIAEIREAAIKRNEVTFDQVLQQLKNWLLFDPISIIDEETECVKSLKDMEPEARMSLAEIQVTELFEQAQLPGFKGKVKVKYGELKKIKFIDKRATADMFMKKFGAYIDNNGSATSDNIEAIRKLIEEAKR